MNELKRLLDKGYGVEFSRNGVGGGYVADITEAGAATLANGYGPTPAAALEAAVEELRRNIRESMAASGQFAC